MCKGERSLFIIPASAMQPQTDTGDCTSQQQAGGMTCLLPPPPAKAVQLEVELELLSVVQVGTQSCLIHQSAASQLMLPWPDPTSQDQATIKFAGPL
jgi:hypothetical protein